MTFGVFKSDDIIDHRTSPWQLRQLFYDRRYESLFIVLFYDDIRTR